MTRDQAHKLTFQNRQAIIEHECQYIFEAIRNACQAGEYAINIPLVSPEHYKFVKSLGYYINFDHTNYKTQQSHYVINWN